MLRNVTEWQKMLASLSRPQLLEDIGALNEREHLTSLGRHLAALPLPPALGKMLLYGMLFSCLDPVLTVACVMAYRWAPAVGYMCGLHVAA